MKKKSESEDLIPSTKEAFSAREMSRYLKRLANFHRDTKTGHPILSGGLEELADAIGTWKEEALTEVLAKLRRPVFLAPQEEEGKWKNMSLDMLKRILMNEGIQKTELVGIGAVRFGISRSRLERMGKTEATEAIRAALRHEESLAIISEEAHRGGGKRTS